MCALFAFINCARLYWFSPEFFQLQALFSWNKLVRKANIFVQILRPDQRNYRENINKLTTRNRGMDLADLSIPLSIFCTVDCRFLSQNEQFFYAIQA